MRGTPSYDAIVIGSGLGGLTAGALTARAGKRVLVVEEHGRLGGAATTFTRKGFTVEVGLHEIDGFDHEDAKRGLMETLGLRDTLELVQVPEFYSVNSPLFSRPFVMPEGVQAALETLQERFSQHRAALRRWFRLIGAIRGKLLTLHEEANRRLWWALNGPIFPLRFWPILRWERATLGEVLQSFFGDDEAIKFALCANFQYYGVDPGRLSFLFFAAAQGGYHRGGGWYVRGGSQVLSDALADHIRTAGGDTLTRRSVREILLDEGGRACGIVHTDKNGDNPQTETAPLLFGNAAPQVLETMLPRDRRNEFSAPWRGRPLSTSLWSIYLGLERDPSELGLTHYSTFCYPAWATRLSDLPRSQRLMSTAPANDLPLYVVANYSRIRSGLATDGRHLVVLGGADHIDNWEGLKRRTYRERKAAWLDAIVTDLDRRYPGVAAVTSYREMATARTCRRYLKTPGGAVYGFAQDPLHAGRHRPGAETCIPGLYLASAFAQPGGGFTGVMLAGQNAFRAAARAMG